VAAGELHRGVSTWTGRRHRARRTIGSPKHSSVRKTKDEDNFVLRCCLPSFDSVLHRPRAKPGHTSPLGQLTLTRPTNWVLQFPCRIELRGSSMANTSREKKALPDFLFGSLALFPFLIVEKQHVASAFFHAGVARAPAGFPTFLTQLQPSQQGQFGQPSHGGLGQIQPTFPLLF
jgi:hypothetical protein